MTTTNGNGHVPSAIVGDTFAEPNAGAVALQFAMPWLYLSQPSYTDLPPWWTPRRDWVLAATVDREAMWGAAVARTATKFAAHGYIVKDANDSQRKIASSQELLKRANGGEGWVPFALKIIQDLETTDNGVFIRIRRANEQTYQVRVKAAPKVVNGMPVDTGYDEAQMVSAAQGAKITGLYHLDSLQCTRTGNLTYPVRYQPLHGPAMLLRYDQVLTYADMPSPRVGMFGVGRCAAGRCYQTIAKLSAMEQLVYEYLTGQGAHKLAFIRGLSDQTLRGIIEAGKAEAQAKGMVYYLGTILSAVLSDTEIQVSELQLKQLLDGFSPKEERDNAYLIYANAIGIPVQDIQPLSGQFGAGTQTVVLEEAGRGVGLAAFIKWWEQTVSDRVLPATTELEFVNEHDMRDQKAKAEVAKMRAETRKARIESGEIDPAMARQIAVDEGDLSRDLVDQDVTPDGQLDDSEKPLGDALPNPMAIRLIRTQPTTPPQQGQVGPAMKAAGVEAEVGDGWEEAVKWAEEIGA